MSETVLKVLLSELVCVRVVCKGKKGNNPCGAIFEMPLDRLEGAFDKTHRECPFCGQEFSLQTKGGEELDPFAPLVKAIQDVLALHKKVEIQFTIPEKPTTKS